MKTDMELKVYDRLPAAAKQIREAVFVKEQGFQEEFDSVDRSAAYLLLFDGEIPVATCRFFRTGENDSFVVGRIAVLKQYRGQGLGARLLAAAEREIKRRGGAESRLHAQASAAGFYEKQGYHSFGPVEPEQGYPHIWMAKILK